jgi:hypothetical protein
MSHNVSSGCSKLAFLRLEVFALATQWNSSHAHIELRLGVTMMRRSPPLARNALFFVRQASQARRARRFRARLSSSEDIYTTEVGWTQAWGIEARRVMTLDDFEASGVQRILLFIIILVDFGTPRAQGLTWP